MKTYITKKFYRKLPSSFYLGIFCFSPCATMGFKMWLQIFHKRSVSNLLNQKKDLVLWDEFTHHKGVSQIASFWFWSGNIQFLTIGHNELPNVPTQILQKDCFQCTESKERFTSVRWIFTSQSSFIDSLFLVFIRGYSFLHHKPQRDSKCPFADSTKRVFTTCWTERKVWPCEMNTQIMKLFNR